MVGAHIGIAELLPLHMEKVMDLVARASFAFIRRCERVCSVAQLPCAHSSTVETDRITLRNVNGVLAEYLWTGRRLVAVELPS